jgi:hypothetical protein
VAEVHRLILNHGRDAALRFDVDRAVIEAAIGYMSSEEPISDISSAGGHKRPSPIADYPMTKHGRSQLSG